MIALFICQQKTFFALSGGLLATNKREDLDASNMVKEYTLFIYIYCTTNIVVTIQSCLKIGKGLKTRYYSKKIRSSPGASRRSLGTLWLDERKFLDSYPGLSHKSWTKGSEHQSKHEIRWKYLSTQSKMEANSVDTTKLAYSHNASKMIWKWSDFDMPLNEYWV